MSNTESFENIVNAAMERVHGNYEIEAIEVAGILGTLSGAHGREIRDTAQQEYHRGHEDGRHSMDAEHRAIAMRLRGLRFDGGSHENLARIAYAIYPCATGWTCESAAGLRDKLIDLMGGVSDDTCACAGGGACVAYDSDCFGEQTEVSDDGADCNILGPDARGYAAGCDFHEFGGSDGGTAHDSVSDSRCGDSGGDLHMAGLVGYDVLDNERRKAIAELRKVCTELDESVWTWIEDVAIAIGAQDEPNDEYESMLPKITDRLIHLLGGNKPSGIDVLRAMDADGTCPNDDQILSITNELRRWALTEVSYHYGHQLQGIADRIDAQFDRICQQQEAVLQETIADVVKEYEHDRLPDQLRIEKLERQRDEARDECDRLKRDMLDKWVPRTSYEEKVEKYRRAYMESDAWRKSLQEKLNAMRDAITAALNG